MKKLLTILALIFLGHVGAHAQYQQFVPNCAGTNDTSAFSSIISTIGSNTGTISLPYKNGTRCAVNNLTIPANITLDNTNGSGIKVNTGQSLNPLGPLVCPLGKQFFYNATSGLGTVTLAGNKQVCDLGGKWWGAVGDNATDNNATGQAALVAAGTLEAARLIFTAGTFLFDGALQGTAGYQGRLLLPYGTSGTVKTIEIVGAQIPYQVSGTATSLYTPGNTGTIFKTTQSGGALISTGSSTFVGIRPVFNGITFRNVDNPQATLLDLRTCFGFIVRDCFFDTGTYTLSMTNPTNTGVYAIRSPMVGNAADSLIEHTTIAGFFFGIELGEHLRMSYLTVNGCARPLYIPAAQNDPITGNYIDVYNCPYTISPDGGATLHFSMLNIEHVDPTDLTQPVWQRPAAGKDIDDASSLLRGYINYHIIKEGTSGVCATADSEFAVTGATKIAKDNACGQPIEIATFFNSWVNVGGGEAPAAYYSKNGETHLMGSVKSGTPPSTAFQLPARYCPAYTRYFPIFAAGNTTGYISIATASGSTCAVAVLAGTNTFIGLDGIVFGTQ